MKRFSFNAEVLFLAKKRITSQPDVLAAWSKLRQEIQPLMKESKVKDVAGSCDRPAKE
ncbi:hypothetical protein IQ269_07300 [Tychonema sp. LEGE 07199]|uniref:hypothetical protein n=1 Tax=unclassified Tychonema TaxID=2642144 RepID=UPI0019FCEE6C|nr:hypothetical protein [Tychonema sp. LEGE 07199]MBE9120627.1 hypothetical protein [Tychonema sp. LEGE 07199]MBE9131989.1 hypothetical protein [Tychonema sp. LEGE 07196]